MDITISTNFGIFYQMLSLKKRKKEKENEGYMINLWL